MDGVSGLPTQARVGCKKTKTNWLDPEIQTAANWFECFLLRRMLKMIFVSF